MQTKISEVSQLDCVHVEPCLNNDPAREVSLLLH